MMAQHSDGPGDPRRTFARPVADQLGSSIRAYDARSPEAEETLRLAVAAAADDARERGLHPQELVIALKAVLEDVTLGSGRSGHDKDKFQSHLLQSMLKAYFRDS